jgi:hypothetical protein
MSRFHDEFFKQKGTKHDDLLIRCLSDENLKKIASEPRWPVFSSRSSVLEGRNILTGDTVHAWSLEDGYSSEEITRIVQEGVSVDPHFQKTERIDYQTEVICKSGSFIIGYADLLISFERIVTADITYKNNNLRSTKTNTTYTLVEVKPELEDVGAVIRQLKTYELTLKRDIQISKCIVCGNQVPSHIQNFLAHEGIKVVVFEESK